MWWQDCHGQSLFCLLGSYGYQHFSSVPTTAACLSCLAEWDKPYQDSSSPHSVFTHTISLLLPPLHWLSFRLQTCSLKQVLSWVVLFLTLHLHTNFLIANEMSFTLMRFKDGKPAPIRLSIWDAFKGAPPPKPRPHRVRIVLATAIGWSLHLTAVSTICASQVDVSTYRLTNPISASMRCWQRVVQFV